MKLIITTKSGRHRKDHEFPIDKETAESPSKRAQAISVAQAGLVDNMVNWRIAE